MICLLTVNDHGGGACVAPFGGIEPRLSTNPLACAIPVGGQEPILLDMSTSVVASGKVRLKQRRNQPVPAGWIIDAEGAPTTNVEAFYANPPGALLPFGGIAAQKGFGLGLLVDILSGALSGAGCTHAGESRPGNGMFVSAINIASFIDPGAFYQEVDRFIEYVKSAKQSPNVEEILVPGERGSRKRRKGNREGIFVERYHVKIND